MVSLKQIVDSLSSLTQDELIEISRQVNREFKLKKAVQVRQLKNNLCVGDSVTFTGRNRSGRGVKSETFIVEGHVTKVKRKRALVTCLGGLNWDVNLSSLTKVEA